MLPVPYPGSNSKSRSIVACQKDTDHICSSYLLTLFETGCNDLVFAAYSFESSVGGSAALGLSKATRRVEGQPDLCRQQHRIGEVEIDRVS